MKIYTIIKQRYNHEDYCRGCVMGRSDSEFETLVTDSVKEAIKTGIDWKTAGDTLTHEKLTSDYRNYGDTQVLVMVNGWLGHNADTVSIDDADNQAIDALEAERQAIEDEIIKGAKNNIDAAVNDAINRKSKEAKQDKLRAERQERAQLASLKAKYEGGINHDN